MGDRPLPPGIVSSVVASRPSHGVRGTLCNTESSTVDLEFAYIGKWIDERISEFERDHEKEMCVKQLSATHPYLFFDKFCGAHGWDPNETPISDLVRLVSQLNVTRSTEPFDVQHSTEIINMQHDIPIEWDHVVRLVSVENADDIKSAHVTEPGRYSSAMKRINKRQLFGSQAWQNVLRNRPLDTGILKYLWSHAGQSAMPSWSDAAGDRQNSEHAEMEPNRKRQKTLPGKRDAFDGPCFSHEDWSALHKALSSDYLGHIKKYTNDVFHVLKIKQCDEFVSDLESVYEGARHEAVATIHLFSDIAHSVQASRDKLVRRVTPSITSTATQRDQTQSTERASSHDDVKLEVPDVTDIETFYAAFVKQLQRQTGNLRVRTWSELLGKNESPLGVKALLATTIKESAQLTVDTKKQYGATATRENEALYEKWCTYSIENVFFSRLRLMAEKSKGLANDWRTALDITGDDMTNDESRNWTNGYTKWKDTVAQIERELVSIQARYTSTDTEVRRWRNRRYTFASTLDKLEFATTLLVECKKIMDAAFASGYEPDTRSRPQPRAPTSSTATDENSNEHALQLANVVHAVVPVVEKSDKVTQEDDAKKWTIAFHYEWQLSIQKLMESHPRSTRSVWVDKLKSREHDMVAAIVADMFRESRQTNAVTLYDRLKDSVEQMRRVYDVHKKSHLDRDTRTGRESIRKYGVIVDPAQDGIDGLVLIQNKRPDQLIRFGDKVSLRNVSIKAHDSFRDIVNRVQTQTSVAAAQTMPPEWKIMSSQLSTLALQRQPMPFQEYLSRLAALAVICIWIDWTRQSHCVQN